MASVQRLRLRRLLDRRYEALLAVALLCTLAGGWVAYGAHVAPGTVTETETTGTWRTVGDFDHRATVTEPNPLYPTGTVLRNRSVYFGTVAPRLEGGFDYRYLASATGDLEVDVRLTLALQGVDGEETVLWERSELLDSASATGVEPGTTVAVPLSVNASGLAAEAAAIREQLGAPGEARALLLATVRTDGTVNGRAVGDVETYRLRLAFEDRTYRVAGGGANVSSRTQTTATTRTRTPAATSAVGGPALALVGLLGLVGLVGARRAGVTGLTADEAAYLRYRADRAEFDEWLTRIRLPAATREGPTAEAEGLADLVDYAIDSDAAVIEDRAAGRYQVRGPDAVYVFEPPTPPAGVDDDPLDRRPGTEGPAPEAPDGPAEAAGEGADGEA